MNDKPILTRYESAPESDPYHADTGGVTLTKLLIDPRDRTYEVFQDYDNNETGMDAWHRLVIEVTLSSTGIDSCGRDYLENDGADLVAQIMAGHTIDWDGNNLVGHLTDDAQDALDNLVKNLTDYYGICEVEFWSANESLSNLTNDEIGITSQTTDEQIAAITDDMVYTCRHELDAIVDRDDLEAELIYRRDTLRDEEDEEDDED